jgi:flagellar biogenesis protein FliO
MLQHIVLTTLLGLAEVLPAATAAAATGEGSATAAIAQPAPPSAADATITAAFGKGFDTTAADLKASVTPGAGLDWTNLAAPALGLVGLAALALALTRRRRGGPAHIAIVESTALGPKRSLVIADVLGDRLVLAVSEAGVTVLSTRAAPAPQPAENAAFVMPTRPSGPGLLRRLFGRGAPARFDQALTESLEDQELRAKLSAGFRGSLP